MTQVLIAPILLWIVLFLISRRVALAVAAGLLALVALLVIRRRRPRRQAMSPPPPGPAPSLEAQLLRANPGLTPEAAAILASRIR